MHKPTGWDILAIANLLAYGAVFALLLPRP